ncbi:pyridoxal-phosphate dependent enzyme [Paludisphaera borealis]|uniref:L-threonine dehydratase catabolic TdcB n=1 Tax=Paludisphaera borealis TaxID=1387353 RepID=A0A1U7CL43_9BACT|nr:pyridoxal-phosphate dependent enzyme [Paludisphaera borealis]APW59660.1 L-threonine dehydratase catabolic TdcB [Paludisphaera borealis]
MPSTPIEVGGDQIREAVERLAPWAHKTPVLTSKTLDDRAGASVFLKCENFQRVGAFKFRGAMNAVLQLTDAQKVAGVVTHSSGNHGQALALAGKLLGVPVTIVMPHTAPAVKREATAGYGATIISCEPTLAAREAAVTAEVEAHGLTLVHPFNDWNVIAGQATVAWELFDQAGPLDVVIAPVGGGGLISGTALAARERSVRTRVIGVEPERADDARRSLASGRIESAGDPRTIADGLRTTLGDRPFAVISRHVDQIVTASEAEIINAARFVWERLKIVIEPSSAVVVAPLLNRTLGLDGGRVGVILSGGNVDLSPFFDALAAKWL